MIDADNAQWNVIRFCGQLDGNCGSIERGVDVVDRDRVVWVRGVTGHVADNAELAIGRRE